MRVEGTRTGSRRSRSVVQASSSRDDDAVLDEHLHQLLDEVRVAVSAVDDQPDQLLRHVGHLLQHLGDQRPGRRMRKGRQPHGGRCGQGLEPAGPAVEQGRASGADDEQVGCAEPGERLVEQIERLLVTQWRSSSTISVASCSASAPRYRTRYALHTDTKLADPLSRCTAELADRSKPSQWPTSSASLTPRWGLKPSCSLAATAPGESVSRIPNRVASRFRKTP